MTREKHAVGPHGAFEVAEVIVEGDEPWPSTGFQNRLWSIKGTAGAEGDAGIVMTGMELLDLARVALALNSASWYANGPTAGAES